MRSPAAAVALSLLAAACSTPTRASGEPRHAVVVWEPSRAADAESARAAMEAEGWTVSTAPAGVARRTRSSLAIYAQRRDTGHGKELAGVLEPVVGEVELLPFLTDGPGGNDAVLWLSDAATR